MLDETREKLNIPCTKRKMTVWRRDRSKEEEEKKKPYY